MRGRKKSRMGRRSKEEDGEKEGKVRGQADVDRRMWRRLTSCGTSCRRSRALMWSRVSMEGERPPCRQKI